MEFLESPTTLRVLSPIGIIALEWLFYTIAFVSVLLRLCVRWRQRTPPTMSDYTTTGALICFTIATSCDTVLFSVVHRSRRPYLKFGEAFEILPPGQLAYMLKVLFASALPYYLSFWLVKISLVLLYYDITSNTARYRYPLHGIAAFVGSSMVVLILVNLCWCLPVRANWATSLEDACITYFYDLPYIITSGMHILTELCLFVYPLMLIRVLRFNKSKFRRALAMFGVGFIGVIVTTSRIAVLFGTSGIPLLGILSLLAALEQAVGIFVCCLPALRQGYVLIKQRKGRGGEVIEAFRDEAQNERRKVHPHDRVAVDELSVAVQVTINSPLATKSPTEKI